MPRPPGFLAACPPSLLAFWMCCCVYDMYMQGVRHKSALCRIMSSSCMCSCVTCIPPQQIVAQVHPTKRFHNIFGMDFAAALGEELTAV